MHRLLVIILSLGAWFLPSSAQYDRLDSLMKEQPEIIQRKEQALLSLKETLRTASSRESRYDILRALSEGYASYQYDSASVYVKAMREEADRIGDPQRVIETRMMLVHILTSAGLLESAQHELDLIDPATLSDVQRQDYYRQKIGYYIYQAEYAQNTDYAYAYITPLIELRRRALEDLAKGSPAYLISKAEVLSDEGKQEEAIRLLLKQMERYHSGQRTYSILTSTVAFYYGIVGNTEQQKHYLILSAESDIEGCIRENTSMRVLSSMLFDEGDIDRAYRYLHFCISDATFYGTRLRNLQASNLMPKVLTAYQEKQEAAGRTMMVLLAAITLIALALAGTLAGFVVLLRRYRRRGDKLSESNSKLAVTNAALIEREKVKEEYLGRFLELCSNFIIRGDDRRKFLLRTARERNMDALIELLKSSAESDEQAKLFYQNFDAAFLNIFPGFCEHVNVLLQPGERIELHSDDNHLTTELRILALIRLGITSNQLIASILRSGLSTIYTYRSRLKARAIDHDNFEAQVKMILNNE